MSLAQELERGPVPRSKPESRDVSESLERPGFREAAPTGDFRGYWRARHIRQK